MAAISGVETETNEPDHPININSNKWLIFSIPASIQPHSSSISIFKKLLLHNTGERVRKRGEVWVGKNKDRISGMNPADGW